MTFAATNHNKKVLEDNNFNIHHCISRYPNSICHPGSEFRSTANLEPILKDHLNWTFLKRILSKGASMYLKEEIPEDLRSKENKELIKYNNHKKAQENHKLIEDTIRDEVSPFLFQRVPNSFSKTQ
jgi:hypothetical protein